MNNKRNLSLSVNKLLSDNTKIPLHINISSYKEADILAQYEMSLKSDNELIIILPGYNRDIKNKRNSIYLAKAIQLAERYNYKKYKEEYEEWKKKKDSVIRKSGRYPWGV